MKKIIIILLICLCIFEIGFENNTINTEETNQIIEEGKEKKTYKISSHEFYNYIKETMKKATDNSKFKGLQIRTRYQYIVISFYTDKRIKEKQLEKNSKEIIHFIFNELRKNNYKNGSIFKYNYEYLNLQFYNYDKNNSLQIDKHFQINILNINKYTDFESFYLKEK